MNNTLEITKDSLVNEIFQLGGIKMIFILNKYSLNCYNCSIAEEETIEQAAMRHNINIENLLYDINKNI